MVSKNQDGRKGQKRKHVALNLAKKLEIIKKKARKWRGKEQAYAGIQHWIVNII
jgi:hypothetical protein